MSENINAFLLNSYAPNTSSGLQVIGYIPDKAHIVPSIKLGFIFLAILFALALATNK